MMSWSVRAALFVLAVAVLVGCGGDGTQDGADTLSQEDVPAGLDIAPETDLAPDVVDGPDAGPADPDGTPDTDVLDGPDSGPVEAFLRPILSPTTGGGLVGTDTHRLRAFVGAPLPMGAVETDTYRLRLGPGAASHTTQGE